MLITRSLFLRFIKVHVLYHAKASRIAGVQLIKELKRHGYRVSWADLSDLHYREKDEVMK